MSTRPLSSALAVGTLALDAVRSAGDAAAAWSGVAGAEPDPAAVAVAYTSERWFRLDGAAVSAFAALSGFFRTHDGWVRTHANYPHHARALRAGLALPPSEAPAAAEEVDQVRTRLAHLSTRQATTAIEAAGGLCVPVATEDPAVDRRLRERPLTTLTRIDAAPRMSASARVDAGAPLHGIRVLDLTRVIAGPVATRTLALLGADVLRVDSPRMPEPAAQHLDTGHGKRSALLDLDVPADRTSFDRLAVAADVVVLGYRPAALARLGLRPALLAARHPGLVVAGISAWGAQGGRGFDSLVQAASGISWIESPDGVTPGALPAQALDHSAGYALAAGIIAALRRRREVGGSWLVETSLRRVAAELLGMPRDAGGLLADPAEPDRFLQRFTVGGHAVVTAGPAIAYAGGSTSFPPPTPWGSADPVWLPR